MLIVACEAKANIHHRSDRRSTLHRAARQTQWLEERKLTAGQECRAEAILKLSFSDLAACSVASPTPTACIRVDLPQPFGPARTRQRVQWLWLLQAALQYGSGRQGCARTNQSIAAAMDERELCILEEGLAAAADGEFVADDII